MKAGIATPGSRYPPGDFARISGKELFKRPSRSFRLYGGGEGVGQVVVRGTPRGIGQAERRHAGAGPLTRKNHPPCLAWPSVTAFNLIQLLGPSEMARNPGAATYCGLRVAGVDESHHLTLSDLPRLTVSANLFSAAQGAPKLGPCREGLMQGGRVPRAWALAAGSPAPNAM